MLIGKLQISTINQDTLVNQRNKGSVNPQCFRFLHGMIRDLKNVRSNQFKINVNVKKESKMTKLRIIRYLIRESLFQMGKPKMPTEESTQKENNPN